MHLCSLASWAGSAGPAVKRQRAGSPEATGCLDFSQGIFGKCQNRNLLTKTGSVSIQAQPRDQVETLLFQQRWVARFYFQVRMYALLGMFII